MTFVTIAYSTAQFRTIGAPVYKKGIDKLKELPPWPLRWPSFPHKLPHKLRPSSRSPQRLAQKAPPQMVTREPRANNANHEPAGVRARLTFGVECRFLPCQCRANVVPIPCKICSSKSKPVAFLLTAPPEVRPAWEISKLFSLPAASSSPLSLLLSCPPPPPPPRSTTPPPRNRPSFSRPRPPPSTPLSHGCCLYHRGSWRPQPIPEGKG